MHILTRNEISPHSTTSTVRYFVRSLKLPFPSAFDTVAQMRFRLCSARCHLFCAVYCNWGQNVMELQTSPSQQNCRKPTTLNKLTKKQAPRNLLATEFLRSLPPQETTPNERWEHLTASGRPHCCTTQKPVPRIRHQSQSTIIPTHATNKRNQSLWCAAHVRSIT